MRTLWNLRDFMTCTGAVEETDLEEDAIDLLEV